MKERCESGCESTVSRSWTEKRQKKKWKSVQQASSSWAKALTSRELGADESSKEGRQVCAAQPHRQPDRRAEQNQRAEDAA